MTRKAHMGGETQLRLVVGCLGIVVLIVVWELIAHLGWINARFSSQPSLIYVAALDLMRDPEFWRHMGVSSQEFLWGMILSCAVGIPFGLAMGWFRRFRLLFEPTVMVFYSVPRTTFLPLIILWFGIGLKAYAFLVFIGAVFPILVNCMAAIQQVDPTLVRAARSFGAKNLELFRFVLLPSSLPYVMSGIRLGIGRGLIGVVLGEMYFSVAGVGNMIMKYQAGLNADKLMFIACFVAFGGVFMIAFVRRLERHLAPWQLGREIE